MKTILIILILIFIVLEVHKIRQNIVLNKKLNLKKRQLRVVDEEVGASRNSYYQKEALKLSLSMVFIFALMFNLNLGSTKPETAIPTNNKDILLSNFSQNGRIVNDSNLDTGLFTASSRSFNLELENRVDILVNNNLMYELGIDSLFISELNGNSNSLIKTILLKDYKPVSMRLTDEYLVVLGTSIKEEFGNEILRDKLESRYDTVVDIINLKDYERVNLLKIDGTFVNLDARKNVLNITTRNNLFYELINTDNYLPKYNSVTNSKIQNHDAIDINENINSEYIYNYYSYDISKDAVNIDSFVLADGALIEKINNDLYVVSSTSNGNTLLRKFSPELTGSIILEGNINNETDIEVYNDNLYIITDTFTKSILYQIDDSFNATKHEVDGLYLKDYKIINGLLLYHDLDLIVRDLENFQVVNTISLSDVLVDSYFGNYYLTIKDIEGSYLVDLYRLEANDFTLVSSQKIRKVSGVEDVYFNYYENINSFILTQKVGDKEFINLVTLSNRGGISSVSIFSHDFVEGFEYKTANISSGYLYFANENNLIYFNLVDKSDYGVLSSTPNND